VDKVLALGEQCPHAIVAALFLLPEPLTPDLLARLIEIDRAPAQRTGAATRKMHAGILALLAGSELPEASEYLRQVWQLDESRRNDVALLLANRPDGDNWAYLVSSLSCLDQDTAGDVLVKLCEVNRRPRDATYYRQLIELGWRLKGSGAIAAIALLEHWAGEKLTSGDVDWQTGIQAWQEWYHRQFPDESPVVQPENAGSTGNWTVSELSAAISAIAPDGDISRGQRLYTTAQCAKCHRFGTSGESMGPDLTSLASRFTRTEVLDAIIHPSKIVSDQYRGKKLVLRNGQTLAGLTTVDIDGRWIVLKSDGERETIAAEDVEDVSDMSQSAMPEGLLDSLTASEIADLVRYLETQAASQIAESPATSESR
jgi:putative heme-binding domain-containing protein